MASDTVTSSKGADALVLKLIDLLSQMAHRVLPWLLLVVALYALQDAVRTLTRQETPAGAWIALMGSVRATRFFAFVFGVSGMLYGLHQRNLRRAAISRLEGRIAKLEALVEGSTSSIHPPAALDGTGTSDPRPRG